MNIDINLSKKSINDAIRKLTLYRDNLANKNVEFCRRLAEIGIPVIEANIAASQGDSDKEYVKDVKVIEADDTHAVVALKLSGTDILFIEFGAGIHYNIGNNHPKAKEFGYGVGTYPGQTHAINPGWWWYIGDDGYLHFSVGTEATMPMLKASHEIMENIRKIAREVYGTK